MINQKKNSMHTHQGKKVCIQRLRDRHSGSKKPFRHPWVLFYRHDKYKQCRTMGIHTLAPARRLTSLANAAFDRISGKIASGGHTRAVVVEEGGVGLVQYTLVTVQPVTKRISRLSGKKPGPMMMSSTHFLSHSMKHSDEVALVSRQEPFP